MKRTKSVDEIKGYDDFVKSSGANLFYQKFWMKFLEKTEDGVFYLYTEKNGKVNSFLGLSLDGNDYYAVPLWVCEKVFVEKDLNEFLDEFKTLNGDSIILGNIEEDQAKRLEDNGFIAYPRYVYPELEAHSMEDFWEDLDKGQKKNLRHALRISREQGIEISNVSSKDDLKEYYLLEEETMKRNDDEAEPLSYWKETLSMIPKDKILFLLAKMNGKAIAGRISFIDKNKIFNFRGVSSKKFQKYRVNELLHLYVIEQAIKRKIYRVDYGASAISRSGSYIFKKKFADSERILWEAVYPLNEKSRKRFLKKAEENRKQLKVFQDSKNL